MLFFFFFFIKKKKVPGTKLTFDLLSLKHFRVADLSAVYVFLPNIAIH